MIRAAAEDEPPARYPMRRTFATGCCARTPMGQATAPPTSAMNCRRLMQLPQSLSTTVQSIADWGRRWVGTGLEEPNYTCRLCAGMPASGQRRRSQHVRNESAYPPIAAGEQTSRLVGSCQVQKFQVIFSTCIGIAGSELLGRSLYQSRGT